MTSVGSRQGATDDGSRLNGGTGSNRMSRGTGSEVTHPANPRPAFSQCRRPSRDSGVSARLAATASTQPPYQPPRRGKSWPARHKALTGVLAFVALIISSSRRRAPANRPRHEAVTWRPAGRQPPRRLPRECPVSTPRSPRRPCRRHILRGPRQPRPRHTRRRHPRRQHPRQRRRQPRRWSRRQLPRRRLAAIR